MVETPRSPAGNFLAQVGSRLVGSRYVLVRLLKSGAGTETLLATDVRTSEPVVIKAARKDCADSSAISCILHDRAALRALADPHLPRLLASGEQDGFHFLVTSLIQGEPLPERLARGPLSPLVAARIGAALLRALHCIHRAGLIHRDVKADNIVLPHSASSPPAVLVDLGFSARTVGENVDPNTIAGTLLTMAPEQVARLGGEIDHRSDLFSAGVVLYEAIAGKSPWGTGPARQLVDAIVSRHPAPLRTSQRPIPRCLEEIVFRLLRKDPEDRYHTAEGAADDLEALAASLDRGVLEPEVSVGSMDVRTSLATPGFGGRRRELAALGEALRATRHSRGGVLRLYGESGSGKSRLLDELESQARQQGFFVVRGGAAATEGAAPLVLLSAVARAILSRSARDGAYAAYLSRALYDRAAELCQLAPDLVPVFGQLPQPPRKVEEHGESSVSSLVCDLLLALSPPGACTILLLDDLQWADQSSLRTLDQLSHRAAAGDELATLAVAAFRSEEVSDDHPLRRLPMASDVALTPMSDGELAALLRSMAGRSPDAVIEQLVKVSGGNPFLASAMLYGLVESGGILPGPHGWVLRDGALSGLQVSSRIGTLLAARIAGLPSECAQVLRASGVLGRTASVESIAEVARAPAEVVDAALREGRARGFGYLDDGGARWAFAHDRVREAFLGSLDPGEARELHLRSGLLLSNRAPTASYEIASHFSRAGDHARALPHAVAAARHARALYAHDLAEQAYRIALQGDPQDSLLRHELIEGLGDTLSLLSRHDEAIALYEELERRLGDPIARARIRARIGEAQFRAGRGPDARASLEHAIGQLGAPVPSSATAAALLGVSSAAHRFVPFLPVSRASKNTSETERARLQARCSALRSLGYFSWIQGETAFALWSTEDRVRTAERLGPGAELAIALADMGIAIGAIPAPSTARRHAESAVELAERLCDDARTAAWHHAGNIAYVAGRCADALPLLERGVEQHKRTGDLWELGDAQCHLAFCCYRLGDLARAVEIARNVDRFCTASRLPVHRFLALEIWSKASGGRIDSNILCSLRELGDLGTLPRAAADKAEAVWLLANRRPADAARLLLATWQAIESSAVRVEYQFAVLPWLATCCRLAAEGCSPAARNDWMDRALRAATRSVRHALMYPNHLPHTLRELGLIAHARGHDTAARHLIDRSIRSAEKLGARHQLAQSLLARSRVAGRTHDDDRRAFDMLTEQGAAMALGEPWQPPGQSPGARPADNVALQTRFLLTVEAMRRIAVEQDPDKVLSLCVRTAREAVGAQRGVVVRRDPGHDAWTLAASDGGEEYSTTLVERAARGAGPFVSGTESLDDVNPSESILLTGVRSCAAVRIPAAGEPITVLHVAHGEVGGAFGSREQDMLEMIASVAGTALDNARAHQHLLGELHRLRVTHEQLRSARESLLSASRLAVVGQLGASLAHELGQPIMLIRGHTDRLKRSHLVDKRFRRDLDVLSRAAQRMGRIVDNVRLIASGNAEDELYDPVDAVDDALTMCRARLAKAAVGVDWKPARDAERRVHGNRVGLQQIVMNLIGRLCDSVVARGDESQGALTIDLKSNPSQVVLTILGPRGIEVQAPRGQEDADLTLARRLLRGQGGSLRVSEQGAGEVSFELALPLASTNPTVLP